MNDFDYYDKFTGEELTEDDMLERFDALLDDVYDDIVIFGVPRYYSEVAKEYDQIAYREAFNNYIDSELGETIVEFEEETDTYVDSEDAE